MKDTIHYKSIWKITKYADDEAFRRGLPYGVSEFEGNLLLNEGIAEFLKLMIGDTATAFSNANAYLGVGDSSTAAAATQTALQASTNKLYKGMASGYPQIVDQTITFRAEFISDEANFSWNEFTAANGNSDSAKNLNRKVSAQGTKASGQTWTLDLSITFS